MNKFSFFILLVLFVSAAEAQSTHIVRLKYKGSAYSLSEPSAYLSSRSIQRRIKQHIAIDSTDLPVNTAYIDMLAAVPGVIVINSSRWLNQVMLRISDPDALDIINSYPFVISATNISWAGNRIGNPLRVEQIRELPQRVSNNARLSVTGDTIDYGNNYQQVHIHEGEYLHNLGFRGQGITIAVLDGGFLNYKTNPVLDSVRNAGQILGEYDFVLNETSVNEDNQHGAYVLSIMASNAPGFIVGTAPKANYWLFRTEDVNAETVSEEENWVVAAERADSAGADMISSSLGYTDFDNPSLNHTYAQRDGNTAIITIGADLAVKKGMIVMNSAGNSGTSGSDSKYVMCPADGDSVVTVGAVDNNGVIWPGSSWGPNGAGKRKPNIVSVGSGAVFATTVGNIASGFGTSYSNPNVAGLIACLWQAFNEFTNMEIIDAVQRSADRYENPDDRYGYGIPNFRIAYSILETKRQEKISSRLKNSWIIAYPVPFKQQFTVFMKAPASGNASLRMADITGRILMMKNIQVQQDNYYTIEMTPPVLGHGVYFLQYADGKNKVVVRLISL